MDFILALHSHLPYVLNHGRWPHGSDWICEAAVDTYLPLLESLNGLETDRVPGPVTLGITPILANQLAHPTFGTELEAFFRQRIGACDEALGAFEAEHALSLAAAAEFWRGRLNRLHRLFQRFDRNLPAALARHEAAGRIEMHLEAVTPQKVTIDGRVRTFERGELIHTEDSYKYAPAEFEAMLRSAGFASIRRWQDVEQKFSVFYASA